MNLPTQEIELSINGEQVKAQVEPRTHLADFLREDKLLTGTHLGCEQGVCGACTIFVDGKPVRSCLTLAIACDGADVRTVEGFGEDALMAQIRESFSVKHGLQCGFCTPGMLTTAYDIIRRLPDADDDLIRRELSGNLCRCTGYGGIVAAIRNVLDNSPAEASVHPRRRETARRARTIKDAVAKETELGPNSASLNIEDINLTDGVTLTRNIIVAAPLDAVWQIVSDLPSIAACIPGAVLNKTDQDTFSGHFVISVGPMKASFGGNGVIHMDNANQSGRVTGRGKDAMTRSSVDGALVFSLEANGIDSCILHLDMTYDLRGPLAQFGRKALVEEIADRLLTDTASAIAARALGHEQLETSTQSISGIPFIISVIRGLFARLLR